MFERLAGQAGLDLNRYKASVGSAAAKKRIADDQATASRAGVEATPTMLVNGEKVEGAVDFSALKAVIDRKLSAAR